MKYVRGEPQESGVAGGAKTAGKYFIDCTMTSLRSGVLLQASALIMPVEVPENEKYCYLDKESIVERSVGV